MNSKWSKGSLQRFTTQLTPNQQSAVQRTYIPLHHPIVSLLAIQLIGVRSLIRNHIQELTCHISEDGAWKEFGAVNSVTDVCIHACDAS